METMRSVQASPRCVTSSLESVGSALLVPSPDPQTAAMTCNCTMKTCPCVAGKKCDVRMRWLPTNGRVAHHPASDVPLRALWRQLLHASQRSRLLVTIALRRVRGEA